MRGGWPYSPPRPVGAKYLAGPTERAGVWFWWRLAILGPLAIMLAWHAHHASQRFVAAAQPADAAQNEEVDEVGLRRKLRSQPLDAQALRQSALAKGLETEAGAQLLLLSHRVSRRDLETQLYLLEMRAREGNIEESLRHYDALLSTRPETSSMLLGILARGLSDPDLRKALANYAAREWFINLIRRSATSGADPRAGLALARETGLINRPASRDLLAPALIGALGAADAISETVWLADQLGLEGWRALGFSDATLDRRLGVLSWKLEKTGIASAQRSGSDGIRISVEPLRSQIIARRETLYRPGTYRLSLRQDAGAKAGAKLEWMLTCPGLGRTVDLTTLAPALALAPEPSPAGPSRAFWLVQIPTDCLRQSWTIKVSGDDVSGAETIDVSALQLERV